MAVKVTFRCKRSGNTVSFTNPDDIEQLRKHESYEEVKNETQSEQIAETNVAKQDAQDADERDIGGSDQVKSETANKKTQISSLTRKRGRPKSNEQLI